MSQIDTSNRKKYLGKYKIVGRLGQGAMGMVYKGFDPSIERYVALKTISSHLRQMDDSAIQASLKRFKQEAKIAGRLNHPNIVSVYEYGEDKNTIFIAMEFVEGKTLKQILKTHNGLGSPLRAVHLMIQLLEALKHSHDNGIIHRDIKPGNIIVTTEGGIKVTDFGIARINASELTQIGTLLGTPSYISPEMLDDKGVDARSDLFSAGVVFYQCLVGQKPFEGSVQQVMNKILTLPHTPPSIINPQLPPEFDRIMDKVLAKNPDHRYQSAEDMIQDLKRLSISTPQKTPKDPVPPAQKKVSSFREAQILASSAPDSQHRHTDKPFGSQLAIALSLLGVLIITAFYLYYDRVLSVETPTPPPEPVGQTNVSEPFRPPLPEPEPKPEIVPPKPLPLILNDRDAKVKAFKEMLGKSTKGVSLSDIQTILKLKVALVNQLEPEGDLADALQDDFETATLKRYLDVHQRVSLVSQGPVDLICQITPVGVTLKNRFLADAPDAFIPAREMITTVAESHTRIKALINRLYAFNTFSLLGSLSEQTDQAPRITLGDTLNNTFVIGNETNICVEPGQDGYLILLNINSANITLLMPHYMDKDNLMPQGVSKCTGKLEITPPAGTEMLVAFLFKDNSSLVNFKYTLSAQNMFHVWGYDENKSFEFCENIAYHMINATDNIWSMDSEIIRIKYP